jgi:hypothetical protein
LFSLQLLSEVAAVSQDSRQALLDAGGMAYLMEVLRKEIPDCYLNIIAAGSGGGVQTITDTIQEFGLDQLLKGRTTPNSRMWRAIYDAFVALFAPRADQNPTHMPKASSIFDADPEFLLLRTISL